MFDDLIRDGDEMTGNGTAGRQRQLYVDGFWGGTWHDCTYGMATLRALGEYQIYQYVYENHRNQTGFSTSCPARLTAWRSNSGYWDDGYVCGFWSPDCVLYSNYPVLNP